MSKLTDLRIKHAKPTDKRQHISDNGSGLFLVVQPSGFKSFATFTRLKGGKQVKIVHGDAGVLTLHDARELNAKAIKEAKQGVDPRAAKQEAKTAQMVAKADTFAAIGMRYIEHDETARLRTVGQVRDRLTRIIFPLLGDKPIRDIERPDVVDALDYIAKKHGRGQANHCLSAIIQVTDFYADRARGYDPPRLKKLKRDIPSRDRVLTDDEIRRVWNVGDRFSQFLLLTAARRNEVAAMQWKEIQGEDWILPAARNMKTELDCVRPLSKAARALLPPRGADDDFIFPGTPGQPLKSFSLAKASLDKASGTSGWRYHDLRRTSRTLLSRAGVNVDHAERCLGHVVGGIRGVYDRWEYRTEKQHAFDVLARQIDLIVNPSAPASKVADLNRERGKRASKGRR
jgi:integrase